MSVKTKPEWQKKGKNDTQSFSLTFKVGDSILVIRDFLVFGYNNKFEHSTSVKDAMESIMGLENGLITKYLIATSESLKTNEKIDVEALKNGVVKGLYSSLVDDLWYKYETGQLEDNSHGYKKGIDKHSLSLTLTKTVKNEASGYENTTLLGMTELDLNLFSTRVRYTIDLRPVLKDVIEILRDYMTSNDQPQTFLNINLKGDRNESTKK